MVQVYAGGASNYVVPGPKVVSRAGDKGGFE